MAIRQVAERLAEILNASSPIENIQVPVRTDDGHMWDAVFTVSRTFLCRGVEEVRLPWPCDQRDSQIGDWEA